MLEPRRVIAAPIPIRRDLGFAELATIVAADALVRRAWALGRQTELIVPTLGGDLASQYAIDRELAREGLDRASISDDDYRARAEAVDEDRRVQVEAALRELHVAVALDAASTAADDVVRAARTAFVRLYEEGQIERAERVVAVCPHCRTPVDAGDMAVAAVEGDAVTVRLTTTAGAELDVVVVEPELLPGVVAVTVPDGHELVGQTVVVPVSGRQVPVLGAGDVSGPQLLVPAHDGAAFEAAGDAGLTPVPVLDADGVVVAEGPLAGLGRYAAREAARELLAAEGAVVSVAPATEQVWRCSCCGTAVVPQLGRHWFLRSGDLEVAAADAVRHGAVEFTPADAREAFLATAGLRRDWCLSTAVADAVPVPAAACLDCGKLTVDVDVAPGSSCGKCMGVLVPEHETLDARFVAAIWALVAAGWPARRGIEDADAHAVVTAADLRGWVLPSLALGIRLAGGVPFCAVTVHPWPPVEGAATDTATVLAGDDDRRVVRLALVAGVDDLAPARAAVVALDDPAPPAEDAETSAAVAAAEGAAALDAGAPAQAAGLLSSALAAGVPEDEVDRVRALALPLLGE